MFERLKVWLSLPFAMPGPINLGLPPTLLGAIQMAIQPLILAIIAVLSALGIVMRNPIANLYHRIVFAVPNWLSNSTIPFLRCEILHKLNTAFADPGRWRTHAHLVEFARTGHFDELDADDLCVVEAGFTFGQLHWLNTKLPQSLKEIYRQRMFAAISTGDKVQFAYRQEDIPDRHMTESDGVLKLHDGTAIAG